MNPFASERRVGLRLNALDALFFRDGRPFDAAARVLGGLPTPQTLAGALRTALLARHDFDFAAFARRRKTVKDIGTLLRDELQAPPWVVATRFRGPWLALAADEQSAEPVLAVPQALAREDKGSDVPGKWVRARPEVGMPGWQPVGGLLPLWRKDLPDAKHPGGFLTLAGVKKFLANALPDDSDWLQPGDLYDFDHRTGIEVDAASLTAAESKIYGVRLLVLRPRVQKKGPSQEHTVCLYAEAVLPTDAPAMAEAAFDGPFPLGGEGKYVALQRVQAAEWPHEGDGLGLWLLATPGLFAASRAHLPDHIPDGQLRAAASATPLAVSGWDVAQNGPRATRFAVPAGAVYYVEGDITTDHQSLCHDGEAVAQGWGFALRGAWKL